MMLLFGSTHRLLLTKRVTDDTESEYTIHSVESQSNASSYENQLRTNMKKESEEKPKNLGDMSIKCKQCNMWLSPLKSCI